MKLNYANYFIMRVGHRENFKQPKSSLLNNWDRNEYSVYLEWSEPNQINGPLISNFIIIFIARINVTGFSHFE